MPQTSFIVFKPCLSVHKGAVTEAASALCVPNGQLLLYVHFVTKGTRPRIGETGVTSVVTRVNVGFRLGRWILTFGGFGLLPAAVLRNLMNLHMQGQ